MNLNFMTEQVDEEVVFLISSKFAKALVSLELRACTKLKDDAIIGMCERFSGIHQLRNGTPNTDMERYRLIHELEHKNVNKSNLEFLNLADLKFITNVSLKSIAYNLFNKLQDLCIWGDYLITNDGFSYLCSVKNQNL